MTSVSTIAISTDVRPISADVQVLPRTHGSAVFTRGETQALATVTLQTRSDEQKKWSCCSASVSRNFCCTTTSRRSRLAGEVSARSVTPRSRAWRLLNARSPNPSGRGRLPLHDSRRVGRARIQRQLLDGHGVRRQSRIDGCGRADPIAGRGHRDGSREKRRNRHVLADILGDEDHLGDMIKVAEADRAMPDGRRGGGVVEGHHAPGVRQARDARLHASRAWRRRCQRRARSVSSYAPRIVTLRIKPDKIREVIGPGSSVIAGWWSEPAESTMKITACSSRWRTERWKKQSA